MSFSEQLRDWRSRRGVSQLELALRAGTTQRHVSFLESGRSRPGRAMVVRLAESLELPLRDRNGLLLAAAYAPAYPTTALDDAALAPAIEALRHILDAHLPYPAVIVGRHGWLVAANAGLALLTEGVPAALTDPPANAYRLALHPAGMAGRIVNLPEWGRHVTHGLRAELASAPAPELVELLAELESYLPALPPADDYLGFAVPLRLRTDAGELHLMTTVTTFATSVDVTLSELRLEAFLPADRRTARILESHMGEPTRAAAAADYG